MEDAVLEAPVVEEEIAVDPPVVDDAPPEETDEPASLDPQDKVDGRKFNPEWSRALKTLREERPELADMLTKLRDGYARSQAYMELAPKGLEDVRSMKTQIEAMGGPEAAADLMTRAAQMDAVDERIAAGDFSVIGELPENLQQGFYQMLPSALADMAEKNPQQFMAAVQPHFQSALKETGLGDFFSQLHEMMGDNEQAKALVKQGYDWFNKQTSGAGVMPQGKTAVDPQMKALQEKLAKYESSEDSNFLKSVSDASNKHLTDSFGTLADVYVKQLNLSKEQQDDLLSSFNERLSAKLGGDAVFQKQLAAYKVMKNRSPETVANYIRSKIDEHAKPLLDGLVKTRYGAMARKPAARTAPGAQPTTGGATHVAQVPDQAQWDQDKMLAEGYENTAKKGVYHLKGGKTVQVVRSA